jgi:hypothetical protein
MTQLTRRRPYKCYRSPATKKCSSLSNVHIGWKAGWKSPFQYQKDQAKLGEQSVPLRCGDENADESVLARGSSFGLQESASRPTRFDRCQSSRNLRFTVTKFTAAFEKSISVNTVRASHGFLYALHKPHEVSPFGCSVASISSRGTKVAHATPSERYVFLTGCALLPFQLGGIAFEAVHKAK